MREIKFRAYDAFKGLWSFFDLDCIEQDQSYRTYFNGMRKTDNTIIEQYTGLKDKNGKEIYENDIIRDYDEGCLYRVLFGEYYAQFMFYDFVNDDYYDNRDIAEHEIIGNIHDNPELLEKP